MAIRLAQSTDIPAVRACAEDAYGQYVEKLGQKPMPMVADFEDHQTKGQLYVFENPDGRVAGYIVMFVQDAVMFLENVAVMKSDTGKGIGKHLIAFCEREARRLNCDLVELYTNEVMRANLKMYPHLGYELFDRRTVNGFHRVFFRKKVT